MMKNEIALLIALRIFDFTLPSIERVELFSKRFVRFEIKTLRLKPVPYLLEVVVHFAQGKPFWLFVFSGKTVSKTADALTTNGVQPIERKLARQAIWCGAQRNAMSRLVTPHRAIPVKSNIMP